MLYSQCTQIRQLSDTRSLVLLSPPRCRAASFLLLLKMPPLLLIPPYLHKRRNFSTPSVTCCGRMCKNPYYHIGRRGHQAESSIWQEELEVYQPFGYHMLVETHKSASQTLMGAASQWYQSAAKGSHSSLFLNFHLSLPPKYSPSAFTATSVASSYKEGSLIRTFNVLTYGTSSGEEDQLWSHAGYSQAQAWASP